MQGIVRHCNSTFPFLMSVTPYRGISFHPSLQEETWTRWGQLALYSQYESTIYSSPSLVSASNPTKYQQWSKVIFTFTRKFLADQEGPELPPPTFNEAVWISASVLPEWSLKPSRSKLNIKTTPWYRGHLL